MRRNLRLNLGFPLFFLAVLVFLLALIFGGTGLALSLSQDNLVFIPPNKTNTPRKPNVLFVCSGNTCRSAMAVVYAKFICSDKFNIDSAGTNANSGNTMTPKAQDILKKIVNIPYSVSEKHRSKKINKDLVLWADYILTMENVHKELVNKFSNWATYEIKEIDTLCSKLNILDPWDDRNKPDPIPCLTYCKTFKQIKNCVDWFFSTTKPICIPPKETQPLPSCSTICS